LAPHSPQNFKSSGFSVWHFGHFILGAPSIETPCCNSKRVRLGGCFDTQWLDKSLLILGENFNKNYQLRRERLYGMRESEEQEYRKKLATALVSRRDKNMVLVVCLG
jgi:hypothetical protein